MQVRSCAVVSHEAEDLQHELYILFSTSKTLPLPCVLHICGCIPLGLEQLQKTLFLAGGSEAFIGFKVPKHLHLCRLGIMRNADCRVQSINYLMSDARGDVEAAWVSR